MPLWNCVNLMNSHGAPALAAALESLDGLSRHAPVLPMASVDNSTCASCTDSTSLGCGEHEYAWHSRLNEDCGWGDNDKQRALSVHASQMFDVLYESAPSCYCLPTLGIKALQHLIAAYLG